MNKKTPGTQFIIQTVFIPTISVMKYLHAEGGTRDAGVTDVARTSKSAFGPVIKGRRHQGDEQMASLAQAWRPRRAGAKGHA